MQVTVTVKGDTIADRQVTLSFDNLGQLTPSALRKKLIDALAGTEAQYETTQQTTVHVKHIKPEGYYVGHRSTRDVITAFSLSTINGSHLSLFMIQWLVTDYPNVNLNVLARHKLISRSLDLTVSYEGLTTTVTIDRLTETIDSLKGKIADELSIDQSTIQDHIFRNRNEKATTEDELQYLMGKMFEGKSTLTLASEKSLLNLKSDDESFQETSRKAPKVMSPVIAITALALCVTFSVLAQLACDGVIVVASGGFGGLVTAAVIMGLMLAGAMIMKAANNTSSSSERHQHFASLQETAQTSKPHHLTVE